MLFMLLLRRQSPEAHAHQPPALVRREHVAARQQRALASSDGIRGAYLMAESRKQQQQQQQQQQHEANLHSAHGATTRFGSVESGIIQGQAEFEASVRKQRAHAVAEKARIRSRRGSAALGASGNSPVYREQRALFSVGFNVRRHGRCHLRGSSQSWALERAATRASDAWPPKLPS